MSQWLERFQAAKAASARVPTCPHDTPCARDGQRVCPGCGEILDKRTSEHRSQEAYSQQEHVPSPPPYPGSPVGAPFRPGHQVWLYRWDNQTPRFAAPVTIVQMRTLWPGEQDIGWCNAAGELTWHNARLAIAVETQEVLNQSQTVIQE